MKVKAGGVRGGIEYRQRFVWKPETIGLVATDGVQYTSVASFGTTAVEVFNRLIDPGFTMKLIRPTQIGLTQEFRGQNGSFVGSIFYYWQARSEYEDSAAGVPTIRTGSWLNFTGTYTKGVGTLLTSEDTFSGYIPVGSLSHAPARIQLSAVGIISPSASGRVKNSSFVELEGNVLIPGA